MALWKDVRAIGLSAQSPHWLAQQIENAVTANKTSADPAVEVIPLAPFEDRGGDYPVVSYGAIVLLGEPYEDRASDAGYVGDTIAAAVSSAINPEAARSLVAAVEGIERQFAKLGDDVDRIERKLNP